MPCFRALFADLLESKTNFGSKIAPFLEKKKIFYLGFCDGTRRGEFGRIGRRDWGSQPPNPDVVEEVVSAS